MSDDYRDMEHEQGDDPRDYADRPEVQAVRDVLRDELGMDVPLSTAISIVDNSKTGGAIEVSSEQLEAIIEERNRYARDTMMLAAAHESVSPHDADTLRKMAKAMQEQAESTPEQAFIFCWWFQYYAEGGTDEPEGEPEAPEETNTVVDMSDFEGGTVIAGTLKPGDLIKAFFAELCLVAPAAAAVYREGVYKHYIADAMADRMDVEGHELDAELAGECAHVLADALNENAPEGFRFGALDGDGADFGWWPES